MEIKMMQAVDFAAEPEAQNALQSAGGMTRRNFLGAFGVTLASLGLFGAGCAAPAVTEAAEEPAADDAFDGVEPERATVTTTGVANNEFLELNRDQLVAMLRDCPTATEDLVLPDGEVIDKAYVSLWIRLNRLSNGLNNTPGVHSFDLIKTLWSIEDAENWIKMPIFARFSAYDYSLELGCSESEALDILNSFADRRLINRSYKADVPWFYVYSWAGALIPNLYNRIDKNFIEMNDRLLGVDSGMGAQYPIYDVFPVSADVVEGGELAPYRDWRAVFERNTVFCAQPCGCRNKAILRGHEDEHEEGILHCMVFGEMAQFLIETGIPPLTKEEALAEAEKLVDLGYVPEGAYAEYPDIMCFCRSDNCALLTPYRNLEGEIGTFPNASAHVLSYDATRCIQCGACVERCPLQAVSQDDEGYSVTGKWCVGCGQCVLTCPADARILKKKPEAEIAPKPLDLMDQIMWSSVDRMATNRVQDFMGTELPAYAIEASEAADAETHANYNWLVDQKPTAAPSGCKDGTYPVTVCGLQGPMEVTTTIQGDKITSVEVGSHHETPEFGTYAVDLVPGSIVDANSLDVDIVSGATHTSMAILRAVETAMAQAGMDLDSFSIGESANDEAM